MQSTPTFQPSPAGGMKPPTIDCFTQNWICELPTLASQVEASIEVSVSHPGIRNEILFGLMNPLTGRGFAVAIDPTLGLIRDLVNGEGVIGFFDNQPFYEQPHHCLQITFETFPHVVIPELHICDDIVLLPSMFMETEELGSLQGCVGSTRTEGFFYQFEGVEVRPKNGTDPLSIVTS